MKTGLMTCALLLGLASFATAAETETDAAGIRQEIKTLRSAVESLNARIAELQLRLDQLEQNQNRLRPWQKKQPYLWDSRHPAGQPDMFRLPMPIRR